MNATALTPEQIAELRDRARNRAGSFVDPRILRAHQERIQCREWEIAVVGEKPAPCGWSWVQICLLHLAREAEPNPPAPELRPQERVLPRPVTAEAPAPPEQPTSIVIGPEGDTWTPLYHVPRSQVWEGSGGGHEGHVHLTLQGNRLVKLLAVTGRRNLLTRKSGSVLCGKPRGWYERTPRGGETRCPRCAAFAERYGINWTEAPPLF